MYITNSIITVSAYTRYGTSEIHTLKIRCATATRAQISAVYF